MTLEKPLWVASSSKMEPWLVEGHGRRDREEGRGKEFQIRSNVGEREKCERELKR